MGNGRRCGASGVDRQAKDKRKLGSLVKCGDVKSRSRSCRRVIKSSCFVLSPAVGCRTHRPLHLSDRPVRGITEAAMGFPELLDELERWCDELRHSLSGD